MSLSLCPSPGTPYNYMSADRRPIPQANRLPIYVTDLYRHTVYERERETKVRPEPKCSAPEYGWAWSLAPRPMQCALGLPTPPGQHLGGTTNRPDTMLLSGMGLVADGMWHEGTFMSSAEFGLWPRMYTRRADGKATCMGRWLFSVTLDDLRAIRGRVFTTGGCHLASSVGPCYWLALKGRPYGSLGQWAHASSFQPLFW